MLVLALGPNGLTLVLSEWNIWCHLMSIFVFTTAVVNVLPFLNIPNAKYSVEDIHEDYTWTGVTTVDASSFSLSLCMFYKPFSNWLVWKWPSFWMVKFTFVSIGALFSIWTRRLRGTSTWLDAQEVIQCWTTSSQRIIRRHEPLLQNHHMISQITNTLRYENVWSYFHVSLYWYTHETS